MSVLSTCNLDIFRWISRLVRFTTTDINWILCEKHNCQGGPFGGHHLDLSDLVETSKHRNAIDDLLLAVCDGFSLGHCRFVSSWCHGSWCSGYASNICCHEILKDTWKQLKLCFPSLFPCFPSFHWPMMCVRSWFLLDLFVVVTDTWGLHPVNSSYLKSNPFFSPRGKFLEAEIARVLAIEDWILLLSGGLEDMEVLRVLRGRIFLRLSELFHWGWLVGWLVD